MSGDNMSDRLSGRVESGSTNDLLRGTNGGGSRDDSSPQTGVAPGRPSRLERVVDQLSDTDRAVVQTLAVVRMASGNQLNRLFWPTTASGARTARRRLQRLADLRVLIRLHRQVGGIKGGSQGYTYALDVNGQRIAQTLHHNTIRRPTPSDTFVDHTLAVTETYVVLWTTRGVELTEFEPEPDCWRRFTGAAGRTVTLRPDAYVAWGIGDWELSAFVEVDRATEHPGRISRKAAQYIRYWRSGIEQLQHDVFPMVLWLTPTEQRAEVLRQALEGDEAAGLSSVITSDAFAGFITNTREEEHP